MAKKLGSALVLGLAAGAAAAGVYHYLQNADKKELADIDDFDDLDNLDADTPSRSSVNLDSAKAFASDIKEKARDVAGKAKDVAIDAYGKVSTKVQEIAKDLNADTAGDAAQTVADSAGEAAEAAADAADDVAEALDDAVDGSSESFFNDEES